MSGRPLKEKIYTPESYLRQPGLLLREMFSDLLLARGLAWRLLVRNIQVQYRQTILGYLWAFIPPLFMMLIWVFLNSQKVISIGDPGMPYPVFVLTGTVLWQTFVDALNSPLKLVTESKGMLAKVNFPRESLILAGMGETFFNFLVRSILLVPVYVWYRGDIAPTLLPALLGIISLVVTGVVIGLFLTPLGVLYRDVRFGIALVSQLWFFLTPVIYPMPAEGFAAVLVKCNPVTPVLMTTRDWMTIGTSSNLAGFLLVSLVGLVLLVLGWLLYRLAMPHLVGRMSA